MNFDNKLIGITGRAGAGKSSVADFLVDVGNFETVAFAEPLKETARAFLMESFSYSYSGVDHYLENKQAVIPELGRSMRHVLQTLGTDWGRNLIKSSLWIDAARLNVSEAREYGDVVIEDVRFEDEAAFIRANGGLIVHLQRAHRLIDDGHVSEHALDVLPGDVVVVNDGSLLDLFDRVCAAVFGEQRLLELCHTTCADYEVAL